MDYARNVIFLITFLYFHSFFNKKMELNKIYTGDCLEWLKQMPDNFIDCCVTSPPYYGLRDYGTAEWDGGDEGCDHRNNLSPRSTRVKGSFHGGDDIFIETPFKNTCLKCGATRIDSQIGLEETPEAYVLKLVEVFHEVKRVLKKEGVLWLNLGDSYCGAASETVTERQNSIIAKGTVKAQEKRTGRIERVKNMINGGLKPKDLIGIPWMVAFALRADGWYLRQDLIWAKPNPMPESVTDRCTKSHEYIFLLSKSHKYYYDAEAIKQESITPIDTKSAQSFKALCGKARVNYGSNEDKWEPNGMANKRSVWTVTTKPFASAHFATFPEDLIVDCIKAGCPENGIVLDPFSGAGTTALVAAKLNRNFIGIELNSEYVEITKQRLQNQLGIFNTLKI